MTSMATQTAQSTEQTPTKLSYLQVLEGLKHGGTLRYFFLDGGVAVPGNDGSPQAKCFVEITTFLGLRERGFIDTKGESDIVGGYPYYANNHKSQIYRIAEKGLEHLSEVSK